MIKNKIKFLIFILLLAIFSIFAFYVTSNVSTFADGSVHLNIINYIKENKTIPKDDFAGQININFRQPRSFVIPMIYPPNIYIFFSYSSEILGINTSITYDYISIILICFSGIILYYIVKKILYSKKIATISIIMFFLLPFRYRSLVHRIVEPISMLSCFTLLFLALKSKEKNMFIAILIGFFLFLIYYIKQSNLYFIIIILVLLLIQKKTLKFILFSIFFGLILGLPAILYSIKIFGSVSPVPPGIPIIDTIIFKPRRNKQTIANWEIKLNKDVDNTEIKILTLKQFTENIQVSNLFYIRNGKINKVIQNYIPLQIYEKGSQGYHILLPETITRLNFLFFIFGIFFLIINFKKYKKYISFFLISFIIVSVFAIKFTVFRYYINFVILNIIIFACGIYFLYNKLQKKNFLIIICSLLTFSVITIKSEASRDLSYMNSIGHRLTNNSGGLQELVSLSKEKNIFDKKGDIFTPVQEVAYYLKKNIYRDEKYLFLNNEKDIIYYLNKAGISYILNPFYSNIITRKNRKYYDGIPSDSTMGKMLDNQRCFKLISDKIAFDLYEIDDKYNCDIK